VLDSTASASEELGSTLGMNPTTELTPLLALWHPCTYSCTGAGTSGVMIAHDEFLHSTWLAEASDEQDSAKQHAAQDIAREPCTDWL